MQTTRGFYDEWGVATTPTGPPGGGLPVNLRVPYPERLSRLLLLVKWAAVIPAYAVLLVYGAFVLVTTFIAFWAIVFTGRYPRGLFNVSQGYFELFARTAAYFPLLLTDYYPLGSGASERALVVELPYPERQLRGLLILKAASFLLSVVATFVLFAGVSLLAVAIAVWFAILVTGRYPRGAFDFTVAVTQWVVRVQSWQYLLREEWSLFGETRGVRVLAFAGVPAAIAVTVLGNVFVPQYSATLSIGGPSEAERESNRCYELAQAGTLEQALASCNRAVELDGELAPAYSNRSAVFLGLARYDEALADASHAIELEPDDVDTLAFAYANRAGARAGLGQFEDAIDDADRAIALAPEDVNALAGAYVNRGLAHIGCRCFDDALDDSNAATSAAPTDVNVLAAAHVVRGLAYVNLERFDDARAEGSKAIELAPADVNVLAAAYVVRAAAHGNLGRFENALDEADRAINLKPHDTLVVAAAHSVRAGAYLVLGSFDQALVEASQAIELESGHPEFMASDYTLRADANLAMARFDDALADAIRAIELAPASDTETRASALVSRAEAQFSLGRFAEAADDASQAIDLNPSNAQVLAAAYGVRGAAYVNLGRLQEAEADVNEACRLGLAEACPFAGTQ